MLRILELSTEDARKSPIIALTANAVGGSEEMFLSKGFQAFLSKPIDIARLDAVLRQWVRDHDKDLLHADVPETQEESVKETISLLSGKAIAGLNIDSGIKRFCGDEEAYINVLHSYSVSTHGLLDSIKNVPEDKLQSYEITVHSIKGSSFGICADSVGRIAADLERAARDCELDYIKRHNSPFIDITRRLISDIDEMLESLDLDINKPMKDKPDDEILKKLITACDAYDMDEVDAAMEELNGFHYEADDGLVGWLKENVDLMNFEEIV